MKDSNYPALYQAADTAAVRAQKHHLRSFKTYVVLAILGAVFSIPSINSKEVACTAALVFIAGLSVSVFMAIRKNESIWYEARAVAESVKTVSWRYMMGTEPFDLSMSDAAVRDKFRILLKSILNEHKELGLAFISDALSADQLSERMIDIRHLDLVNRKEVYLKERIQEQRTWYTKKSKYNRKTGAIWFWILVLAQGIVVTLSILRIAFPDWKYWPTQIFVIAGTSTLAWIQLKRFRELAASYALAAQEIGIAQILLDGISSDKDFSDFVRDTENAFSREHTQWIAKKE